MSATCKSCGAEILWVTMEGSGKPMPLDVASEQRVVVRGERGIVVATYLSHFSTCPQADEHRRKQVAA